MAIGDDFTIAANGDIRHVSGQSATYTVIQFHRWLGDLMDDAAASGDDFLDITSATADERATDNLITLKQPFNIDQDATMYLYDGTIIQSDGDERWDGLLIIAPIGTHIELVQNGALVTPNYWTTGLNADAVSGYSHRFMIKVRTGGFDIDGRRLLGFTREFGETYSEFAVGAGTNPGNNVLALPTQGDLNNQTAIGTVSGWSTIDFVTEGYVGVDITGDTVDEPYYAEWTKDTYTINQFYERMKWLTRRGSSSTLYGLNGQLFRGITHQIPVTNTSGTWAAYEAVEWTGGTGQMLAVDSTTSPTKMWIQLLTGTIMTGTESPALTISASSGGSGASSDCSGAPISRTISQPFVGASTGSALIGAYGIALTAPDDVTDADTFFDLDNPTTPRNPPNNVTFNVTGLGTQGIGDRVLVAPLGYRVRYDNEANGPFTIGETVTFGGGGTAYVSDILDKGTYGWLKVRMLTGDPPLDDETITGDASSPVTTADANTDAEISEDPRQLILATTLSGPTESQAVVNGSIPSDTPTAGWLRIKNDSGYTRTVAYNAWSSSTFTFTASEDFSGTDENDQATGGAGETGNSVYIGYIDKNATSGTENWTGVYLASRDLFVRARYGDIGAPIKTFQTSGTLTNSGGSATVIRTDDA